MSRHSTSSSPQIPQTEGRTISWAARYDAFVSFLTLGRASAFRRRTADLAHLSPGEAVLDVACGTGDLTMEVYRRVAPGGRVAGVDASPEMIARARHKAARKGMEIDFRLEPVEAMSLEDASFDVVVCSAAFHHFPGTLKQRALSQMKRVLKPGGRVVIVDFLHSDHLFHPVLQVGVQDLPVLLTEAGFLQVEWQRGPLPMLGTVKGVSAS